MPVLAGGCTMMAHVLCVAKEPYVPAKELYVSANEPYESAKESYVSACLFWQVDAQ